MKIEPEFLYDKIRNKWARHVVKENFERMDKEIQQLKDEVERLRAENTQLRQATPYIIPPPFPAMPPYPYADPPVVTYGDKTDDPIPARGTIISGSNSPATQAAMSEALPPEAS